MKNYQKANIYRNMHDYNFPNYYQLRFFANNQTVDPQQGFEIKNNLQLKFEPASL